MKGLDGGLVPLRGADGVWREWGRTEITPRPIRDGHVVLADRKRAREIRRRVRARLVS